MLIGHVQRMRQFVHRQGLDHTIALMACMVLVFFAIGTKVAWYHPKEPSAKPIASAKIWLAKQVLAEPGTPIVPVVPATPQAAMALILLFSVCVMSILLPHTHEQSGFPLNKNGLTPLAVRPPPTI